MPLRRDRWIRFRSTASQTLARVRMAIAYSREQRWHGESVDARHRVQELSSSTFDHRSETADDSTSFLHRGGAVRPDRAWGRACAGSRSTGHAHAGVHPRGGPSVRRRSLPDCQSGGGAGQCICGGRARRQGGIPPASRFALAVEQGDGEQHLRSTPAPVGHPSDDRTGAVVRIQPERLEQRRGRAVLVGTVRLRPP